MSTLADGLGSRYNLGDVILSPAYWDYLNASLDLGILRVFAETSLDKGLVTRDTNPLVLNETTNRFDPPSANEPAFGSIGRMFFYMTDGMEVSSTADDGTTTSLDDSALSGADDYWVGAWIEFTSGTNDGEVRQVTTYGATNNRLAWTTPLAANVQNGDTYTVTFYYVSGLTNGSLNYIYGTALSKTPYTNIIQFTANITGTTPAGGIYLGTLTLDGAGVATASDSDPTDADRTLYVDIGAHHTQTLTGTVAAVPAGASVQVTRSHNHLLYRGGMTLSVPTGFTYTMDEYWKADEVVFTVTNGGSYAADCAYTLVVNGRQRRYPA